MARFSVCARFSGATTVIAACLSFAAAHAATLAERADAMAKTIMAAGKPPALVIAVVKGEQVFVAGYGETAPGSGVKPDARSLVRIASLSKLFAADLLAAMAADNVVTLADPLQAYAPRGRKVPLTRAGTPIALLHLATHTSGLPREATAERWDYIESLTAVTPPGYSASYSNLAFDLLADALADAGGAPYPELLYSYTLRPLGLDDTTVSPSADQCARLIRGAKREQPCRDETAMAGAGGLYSTAADMALWMQAQLGVGESRRSMRRAIGQRVYFDRASLDPVLGLDHGGKISGVGLGWVVLPAPDGGATLLEKTGNISGFMSYVAISPEHQAGVFVAFARPAKPGATHKAMIDGVNGLTRDLAAMP